MKHLKIIVPQGYEIDEAKSTFVFKKLNELQLTDMSMF
jgi:hypothetical protein